MLILGCGYVGHRVARRQLQRGHGVAALTRSEPRAEQFQAEGVTPLVGDLTRPESLENLRPTSDGVVLVAVGYDRQATPSITDVYVDGLRNALDALHRRGGLSKLVYLSSTGVYGSNDGSWVDEDSPCEPLREGGRACLEAERLLASHQVTADRHVTLRLAGIYGPSRVPRLDDLRQGRPIPAPDNTWLNLIHVDDVVGVIEAAVERAPTPSRYCVADSHPIRRHDYYRLIAELAGGPPPQLTPAEQNSPAAARAAADKRVSNKKLLSELEVSLKHPDCRSGLVAVLNHSRSQ